MDIHQWAQELGRRGGLARARRLVPEQRKKIASQGGRVRALTRHAARRVEENFYGWHAVQMLRKLGRQQFPQIYAKDN